jgi:hypothetical protein
MVFRGTLPALAAKSRALASRGIDLTARRSRAAWTIAASANPLPIRRADAMGPVTSRQLRASLPPVQSAPPLAAVDTPGDLRGTCQRPTDGCSRGAITAAFLSAFAAPLDPYRFEPKRSLSLPDASRSEAPGSGRARVGSRGMILAVLLCAWALPSLALIPKDPETAVELLWTTMDRVRQARPTSSEADPMVEIYSGFELLAMYEAGEAKRSDRTDRVTEDQVDQLWVATARP